MTGNCQLTDNFTLSCRHVLFHQKLRVNITLHKGNRSTSKKPCCKRGECQRMVSHLRLQRERRGGARATLTKAPIPTVATHPKRHESSSSPPSPARHTPP